MSYKFWAFYNNSLSSMQTSNLKTSCSKQVRSNPIQKNILIKTGKINPIKNILIKARTINPLENILLKTGKIKINPIEKIS